MQASLLLSGALTIDKCIAPPVEFPCLGRAQVEQIIATAGYVRQLQAEQGPLDILSGQKLGVMFLESSKRTSSSLQAAMHQMGGKVLRFEAETSEPVSADTLAEAMQAISEHCDVLAVRHSVSSAILQGARGCSTPIMNMGDGQSEHPTQALLDATVMSGELGTLDGLTVTIVGDLAGSRSAHSMVPTHPRIAEIVNGGSV